ncbi:clavesin-1-like isoform X2 [Varroa jacobsoni]|uniref:clavesin-1-like isoform X2 n=1 Tax=Varroa jacobsoni TaxID=62625 RepID=UPI000BF7FEFB|nr:clavesin-1-like isoform X2 [Varroa jacobsoni]
MKINNCPIRYQQRVSSTGSTVVVATFEFFEPSRWHNLQEMYTPMALQVLMLLRDPEVQVRGFRMVVDLKKFSFKYIRYVPTSLAKVMGESSSGAMPVTIRGVHVINEPVWYQVLMKMIAPFLTDGESVTQTHGNDLASLHRIIDRSILPKEFGGAQGSVVFETQVMEEFYARDKEILAASRFGYKLSDTGKTWQSTSKTDDRRGSSESSNSLN